MGRALQAVGALLLASVPFWLNKVVDPDSYYFHLLRTEFFVPCLVILGLIIFTPQIFAQLHRVWRAVSIASFEAFYPLRKGRPFRLVLFLPIIAILIVGLSNLLQGTTSYGFSLLREVKYAKEISRQRLVMSANAAEKEGLGRSIPELKKFLQNYPNNDRNIKITARLERFEQARLLSSRVTDVAKDHLKSGRLLSAAETFKAAVRIWPQNRIATEHIQTLYSKAAAFREEFRSMYLSCSTGKSDFLLASSPAIAFVLREPKILERLQRKDNSKDVLLLTAAQAVCVDIVEELDADQYADRVLERFKLGES